MSNVNSTRHRGIDDDQLATPVQQGLVFKSIVSQEEERKKGILTGI